MFLDVESRSLPTRRAARRVVPSVAASILALFLIAPQAHGVETLADGVTVRIRSAAIESGWHTGRIKRDARLCSTVQLDRPTERGRTSLALLAVDALQLGRIGSWTAVSARHAIASEPAHCLAAAAD